jgi:hypothetical protein
MLETSAFSARTEFSVTTTQKVSSEKAGVGRSGIAWVVRGGKLQDVLFERLTQGLESLTELYDRYAQNVTNANQI